MDMINNTCDAFENLISGDSEAIEIKINDKLKVMFQIDEINNSFSMQFTEKSGDIDDKLITTKTYLHIIKYDDEMMDGNKIMDKINFILEQFEDFLNLDFGIAPIGITRWKNSNCNEISSIEEDDD